MQFHELKISKIQKTQDAMEPCENYTFGFSTSLLYNANSIRVLRSNYGRFKLNFYYLAI